MTLGEATTGDDRTTRPIGSDFEWVSDELSDAGAGSPPVLQDLDDEQLTLTESGRQAITIIADHLRDAGYEQLVAPTYYCESMLLPFQLARMTLSFVPTNQFLQQVPPEGGLAADLSRTAILSAAYFGVEESDDWREFLRHAREGRAVVVSDETHRIFGERLSESDYWLGSLRKMLPVPDGGFLIGVQDAQLPHDPSVAKIRAEAMVRKREYLGGGAFAEFRSLFATAEHMTEDRLRPVAASDTTASLLEAFRYDKMAERRCTNWIELRNSWDTDIYSLIHAGIHSGVRSHAVVQGPLVRDLQAHMAARGIYCPIHWPQPEKTPSLAPWPNSYLSLPIDHRYDATDMYRIASAVNAFATARLGS